MTSSSAFPTATSVIEKYMVDTVKIIQEEDIDDQPVDEDLQLIPASPLVLYEGKALLSPMGDPGDIQLGLGNRSVVYYNVALPVLDVHFPPDCWIIVVSSKHEGQLTGCRLRVEGEVPSTLNVYKRLRARLDVEAS